MALILFFAVACYLPVSATQVATNRVFDCGVNAVYLVRRLKNMNADLKEISGRLARDSEKGSSIHDLETYLHSVGIQTDDVSIFGETLPTGCVVDDDIEKREYTVTTVGTLPDDVEAVKRALEKMLKQADDQKADVEKKK